MNAPPTAPQSQDDWDSHWSTYAGSATLNPAQIMRHKLILKALQREGAPFDRLLDVGSGQGDFLTEAVAAGVARAYAGFELSESGVRISSAKLPQVSFHRVDLFAPGPDAEPYRGWASAAVCSEVVEHVDDPAGFLRALSAYLSPGAPLVLTVPGGPRSAFDIHIGHRQHFTAATIGEALRAAGFEVEQVWPAGFPFFNLYRMVVVLRGRSLISDVASGEGVGAGSGLAGLVMTAFRLLFPLNLRSSPFGWQIVAIARKPRT